VRLGEGPAEQTWIITTRPEGHALGEAPTIIYSLSTLPDGAIDWLDFACGVKDAMNKGPVPAPAGVTGGSTDTYPCRRVRIAVDTDWEYTARFGGNTAASEAYIHTLMGAVSEIYTRELNVSYEITYTRVWSTSQDPFTTPNVSDRLGEFRTLWNSSMGGINRNIAHMLSGLRAGSGGVAWVGVLCNSSYSYAISGYINGSFPYPLVNNHSQNWDLMVVAHEIGHNFRAPHTHSMSPPVDGCGNSDCSMASQGTIMSYCHTCSGGMTNIRLDLHPRVISEHIMPYLNSISCVQGLTGVSITAHPQPRTVRTGEATQFSAAGAGSGPLAYRWMRSGLNLSDGGGISGATTPMLSLSGITAALAGEYSVRVSNSCGATVSSSALLTVLEPCYANCDQSLTAPILNIDDFSCYLTAYANAQALPQAEQLNHYANCDGSTAEPALNIDDFVCFMNRFAMGCP
jgi:hypothetical protein